MKVVILGCGRVGARLAMLMQNDGYQVSIIDMNPEAFSRLPESFKGRTILGVGIDVDVLKSAGIESADAFAAVTNGDNTNIMASQIAKEIFSVPKVLARIYDPGRGDLYHELGLETVCPTTLISSTVHDILVAPSKQEPLKQTAPLSALHAAQPANTSHMFGDQHTDTKLESEQGNQPSQTQADKSNNTARGLRGLFRP